MSYTKNTWANGDIITAAKLNNMENGIADAGGFDAIFKCNSAYLNDIDEVTLEKGTYETLAAKFLAEKPVTALVYGCHEDNGDFYSTTFCVQKVMYDSYVEGDPVIVVTFTAFSYSVDGYVASSSGGSPIQYIHVLAETNLNRLTVRTIELYSDGEIYIG